MAVRPLHRLFTCGGSASASKRGKVAQSEYDLAFKLTRQPLSSEEGEILLLFIPKRKDAKAPAKRRKTSGR
jgi:hypothetical protein